MGVLVVLLVVIARNAQVHAREMAQAKSNAETDGLDGAKAAIDARIAVLRSVRDQGNAQLEGARLDLGHLEDHIRRLQLQLRDLEAAWRQMEQFEAGDKTTRAELAASLAQVRDEIAQAEAELAAARQRAGDQRGSYAVVFHHAQNETFRRPMYVECRESAVVIQPEGIELKESDFQGPVGPGNPLSAALRAYREYLLAKGRFNSAEGEPYPLLLVRPKGIGAYYAARTALQSWGSDFGYQLIEEDWPLVFPEPDPILAGVVTQTVSEARGRMEALAAAAPGIYGRSGSGSARTGRSGRPEYRVAPNRGGAIPANGFDDELRADNGPGGYRKTQPERVFGREFTLPEEVSSEGDAETGGSARASEASSAAAPAGAPAAATGTAAAAPQGLFSGQQPGAAASAEPAENDRPLGPGEWQPGMNDRVKPPEEAPGKGPRDGAKPIAERRGRDWALPKDTRSSIPVTRPIHIDCYADQLVIVPDSARGQPHAVAMPGSTESAMEAFVSGVWDHMNGWGIAGQGMYWKPILHLHVAPDAEQRAAELETLLRDSGVEVKRAAAAR